MKSTSIKKKGQLVRLVAAAFALAAFAPVALADADVAAGDLLKFTDGPGTTNGGEFLVDNLSNGVGNDFTTFCLEKNEFMNFSSTFKVGSVSNQAVDGGVGGGSPDPLDYRTAWLYTQFRAGTLSGYLGDDATANSLQNAIWHLEDEGVSYASLDATAQGWVTAATSAGWTSLGDVRVINLQYLDGTRAQDQLTMIPEPETYAMLLAGLGLMGFVARRRRKGQPA